MGRAYALAGGEDPAVADAVRDHYKPAGASDDVAPSDVAAVVALADRFDTLAGCFAVGLAPTGAADPFALRRACIGVLRTLLDRGYARLAFTEMVGLAYDGLEGKKLDLSRVETEGKLDEFATERLRGVVAGETSNAVADAVLAATAEASLKNVVGTMARARALQAVVAAREPWLEKAKTVAKRLAGISREAKPTLWAGADFKDSKKADDQSITGMVERLDGLTQGLENEAAVRSALMTMEKFATELDRIFVETLVNDPADPFTGKRLETLAYGAQSMLRIADFSRLA
jgi:glycyl-tRNA synthetase beta chain